MQASIQYTAGVRQRFTRLCFIVGAILATSQAWAKWDENALAQAADKARQEAAMLANKRGAIYKALGYEDARREALSIMQFDHQGQLINKADVYQFLANRVGVDYSIGLNYAAAQESGGLQKNRYLLDVYSDILEYDYPSQKFALDQLGQIASQFNDEQYKEYKNLIAWQALAVNSVYVEHDQDQANMCLQFNKTIASEPEQQWRTLVDITPKPLNDGTYRGDSLCYRGEWQTTYTIEVSPELISDNGIPLGYNEPQGHQEAVFSGDRDAMIRLGTQGQTMIADEEAALTVESANIDTVAVKVWSIPLTNLAQKDIAELLNPMITESYYFSEANINRNARVVFEGEFDPDQRQMNSVVQARLRLADMGIAEGGIYIVQLTNKYDSNIKDKIAFSVAEVGFSAYQSDDGLWAELRDLRDYSPVRGAEVMLYSRDNAVLASAKTDKQGIASFAQAAVTGEGGAAPDHLIYQDGDSLAYLYVDHQGYDLSDKGLDDRSSQPEIQSWLWLDRGVYRPNDTMHAMWLLRHDEVAYTERDLWLQLRRPDGSVMHEQMVSADASGAYHFDYEFANTARLGPWQLSLSLGKDADVIDQAVVRVDAIVAQQIETALKAVSLSPNIEFALQADWLYGSPAKGLRSDGEWSVKPREWQAYKDWQFGRHDETLIQQTVHLASDTTDDSGHRSLMIDRSSIPASTQPLSMSLKATVYTEDGQAVSAKRTLDVPREQPYAALEIADKQAQVMLIHDNGTMASGDLEWSLYRVVRNGYWYRTNDNYWQYQYSDSKTLEDSGTITTNANKASTLDLPIDDGLWLLEVNGADSLVAASTMIEFGSWTTVKQGASPETLTVSSDKARYQDGEQVKLNIRAPFDGVGSVKLAHGDIFKTYTVEFKNHAATLSFKWDDEWSQGVWVLASAWRAHDGEEFAQTERAVGLTWLGSEFSQFALNPGINAPAEIKPDGKLSVTIDVPDADDDTWVNVAIIDEGLYRLAPPSFSNPLQTFYGKPSWALTIYDIWGEIIRQTDAAVASLRSGADGAMANAGMADLPNIDTPLITYWSMPQPVVNGQVLVTMDVPRFHGKLRVMALAYNDEYLGSAEGEVIVKEDVVSNLYAPLFASPDDQARARIRLHNTTEQAQTVLLTLTGTGVDMQALEQTITLAPDEERWVAQAFTVAEQNDATLTATVNDATLEQRIDIRPRALSELSHQYQFLAAGESTTVPLGSAYTLGGLGLDDEEIAQSLRRYPYYCSEQTASRLYSAIGGDESTRADLYNTQARLANLQRSDGGFGLWKGSQNSDIWLSAFIGESLLKAQTADELNQQRPLTSLLNYLRKEVTYDYGDNGGYGYAHYVLAKAGVNMQGAAIRYSARLQDPGFDSDNLETVLALYLYGENERAEALWQRLSGEGVMVHYQTELSELAKRLYRLHELSEYRDVSAELGRTQQSLRAELDGTYSTQEMVWLHSLADFATETPVSINGNAQSLTTLTAYANDNTTITNNGQQPLAVTVSSLVDGDPEALIENGYSLTFSYSDFDGQPLTADFLPVNQKVLLRVRIARDEALANRTAEIMFVYPYTAGEQGMQWTGSDDSRMPVFSENRDDRHLAAFTMEKGDTEIIYELAVRTARVGTWHAPGASIEDMYRPDLQAQYPTRTLVVKDNAPAATESGDEVNTAQTTAAGGNNAGGLTLQSLFTADEESAVADDVVPAQDGQTNMSGIKLESIE